MADPERLPVIPGDIAVTTLHVGAQQTIVTSKRASEAGATMSLPIGFSNLGGAGFRHEPPTAAELENAIMTVEDELFRIRNSIVAGSALFTADASARAIAAIAGVPGQSDLVLSRELVEQTFDRLAAIVQGRPASQDTIPTDAGFSASLLILREFMHHLKFTSITIQ